MLDLLAIKLKRDNCFNRLGYIFLIDRLSYAGDLNRINEVFEESNNNARKRFKFIYHDLKAPLHSQILKQLESVNTVLHIGASSHVNRSIQDPSIFVQDNIVGTFNILEASRKLDNIDLFYYFSTDEVFGPSDEISKIKEWDRYNSKTHILRLKLLVKSSPLHITILIQYHR